MQNLDQIKLDIEEQAILKSDPSHESDHKDKCLSNHDNEDSGPTDLEKATRDHIINNFGNEVQECGKNF